MREQNGSRLLEAVQERFPQCSHGLKAVVLEQGAHAFPHEAFAAQLRPHRAAYGTAQLRGLVHQKRQHPQDRTHHREMLRAMPVIVLKVVALIFQGIARLICNLPPGTSTPPQAIHIARAHPQVCYPAQVRDLPSASLPILHTIDPHVRVRGMERHIIDQAQPMPHPSGAVMACRIRDASSVLGGLPLGQERSRIAGFDPEHIMQPMIVPGLAVGGIGTHTVFGDEARERGGSWRSVAMQRLAACRSPALLPVPSWVTMGAGIHGIPARRSGGSMAAPTICWEEVIAPFRWTVCRHDAQGIVGEETYPGPSSAST